ncbi:hypothetical protein AQUCO_04900063v1 [Aquilegia coerulea]|uniref:RING-type domain-containing protein n=1 Tax=Aquilegia coerulea TaxID=218851 RepID=A0A2G5CJM1_AQUCA|nr:hypothetical protein AQUCO_04900063v1 [Aquilegia coerulea]PIA31502.1 hypothetical protein AQUCO_04900063v1 [Aquilegia coerulea]
MMANQVMKLRKEAIVARITCSICNKLFRDATTISECLHTFCRKCIYKKLTHEELDRCPICSINLGCAPLEKLRPDHNLQDVRAKIFPFKRRKVSAPENMASISLPVRRKERSLSSLVVSTPRVSPQTSMTGRRTKSIARKAVALRGSGFSIDQSIKREDVPMEGCPESSSSRETLTKLSHHKRQTSGNLYNNLNSSKHEENDSDNLTGKADLCNLNTLVEAANRTKPIKFHSQGSDAKPETPQTANNGTRGPKGKVKKNSLKKRNDDDDNDSTSVGLAKSKKLSRAKRKRKSATEELGASAQAILSSSGIKRDRSGPIWFHLVASEDQEGNRSLPQIPSSYVRLGNGDIPVSVIQKFVMGKLNLSSEAEVEITCRGQPVDPTVQLPTVVDAWLQSASRSERIQTSVGASGKDFVMVLGYRRKIQPTEVL